jgi:hypothetical protein
MGVRFRDGAECVGVLVPVNRKELTQFDKREIGYDRVELQIADIMQVAFLEDTSYYENTFLDKDIVDDDDNNDNDDVKQPPKVWVYIQQNPIPATGPYPIVQSYVDVILRGCLTISEEFAHEFIATTKGWDPAELSSDTDSCCSSSDDEEMDDVVWLDDRNDPIYVRADTEYSLRKAPELDRLLRKHHPHEMRNRRRRVRAALAQSISHGDLL